MSRPHLRYVVAIVTRVLEGVPIGLVECRRTLGVEWRGVLQRLSCESAHLRRSRGARWVSVRTRQEISGRRGIGRLYLRRAQVQKGVYIELLLVLEVGCMAAAI